MTTHVICTRCGEQRPAGQGHVCADRTGQRIVPPQGGTGVTRPAPAPPADPPACRDCKHFARLTADAGECRYNPPTSRAQERWPWVAGADFCGRFELAAAGQPGGLTRITEG